MQIAKKKRDKIRMSKYIITIFKILELTPESQSCKENKNSIFVFLMLIYSDQFPSKHMYDLDADTVQWNLDILTTLIENFWRLVKHFYNFGLR
jgi:hypothetical protein